MLTSTLHLFCDVIVVALIRVRLLIDFYVGTARKLPQLGRTSTAGG